jgi:hypothetical protein
MAFWMDVKTMAFPALPRSWSRSQIPLRRRHASWHQTSQLDGV